MTLTIVTPEDSEDLLSISPYDQITSLQERVTSLENQVHEIKFDLPQNISKSILYMKKEMQTLLEKSDAQPETEVPYVYSEILEKIGDFQRRIEWKLKDTVNNKIYDTNFQFEGNRELLKEEEEEDETNEKIKIQKKISELLINLESNVVQSNEENRKKLNELEEQIIKIKFQSKAISNSPTTIISYVATEIESQQKQISELERALNQIPNIINNSRRFTERFSGLSQSRGVEQPIKSTKNDKFDQNESQTKTSFDSSTPLSSLESEFQTTIKSLQFDLDNVLQRIETITQKTDENEQQIMKIADAQGKAAEILSDTEEKALSMLDKTEDFSSKLSTNSSSTQLEEIEKEARTQVRKFKKEISTFKSEISKREAQIDQTGLSTT